MRLSIIIPTYNNHISDMIRCLDSVYDTAYQDFEVLMIDDGSEVSYQVELDQLETRYERLMVLHKAHAGVSAARNFGVQKAQGDYILFVDADDVVTKKFWRDVWKIAEDRTLQADIVYGLVNDGRADGVSVCDSPEHLDEEGKKELYRHFFALGCSAFWTREGHVGRGPCARMIRKKMALIYPFDEKLAYGEDAIWNLDLLSKNPSVVIIRHIWYQVIGDPRSATRGYHADFIERLRAYLSVLKSYEQSGMERDYHQRLFEALGEIGRTYFLSPQNPLPWNEKVKEFNKISYSYPFNGLLENDVKMGGVKPLLKLALYRAGLLLYVYKLKMMLHR